MAGPRARFRQDDVTRAARGAEAAGLRVLETMIMPDGTIVLVHDEAPQPEVKGESTPPDEIEL
jgi:hypothetical protein